jgi:uncharacterized MnhB-related membrane protein
VSDVQFIDLFFLLFALILAVVALRVRDLVAAVVLFGAFSFCSATLFAVMGAVDVAFTEAVVGAAIATVFFMAALGRTSRRTLD